MKNRTFLIPLFAAVLAMAFSACATTPQTQILTGIISDAAAIVLTKNENAVPVVRSLSLGIDAALTTGTLPPEKVKTFLDLLDKDASLTPGERLIFARAIQRTHQGLVAYVGTPDINVNNARVRSILEEIKRNLDETLALHDALKS